MTTDARIFPALRVLERQTPPNKYGRPPYWRAPAPYCAQEVYIPTWNWQGLYDFEDGQDVTVLDVVAAYLAAIGSAKIAHSHLVHRGAINHLPEPRKVQPGYYRINTPYWAFTGTIVHPLGDSARVQTEDTMWIAAPTLILLLELAAEGHLGQLSIIDSWTPDVTTDFLSWAARLRSLREEILDRLDMAQLDTTRTEMLSRYDAFKTGYSVALSMMLTGKGCGTHRPDWAHQVYAMHAANTWRKAWKFTFIPDTHVVSMGAVDELAILTQDLPRALGRTQPPFRYDPRGRQVGAFRTKTLTFIGCEPAQRADSIHLIDEDDIL